MLKSTANYEAYRPGTGDLQKNGIRYLRIAILLVWNLRENACHPKILIANLVFFKDHFLIYFSYIFCVDVSTISTQKMF